MFRRASFTDLYSILTINDELEYDKWSPKRFIDTFEYELPIWVLEQCDKKVIGYVVCLPCLDEIKVLNFAVLRRARGQGHGKRLLAYTLLDAIESFKVDYALLDVRINNYEALEIYTKIGFEILCVRENYYTSDPIQDSYFMQLQLNDNVKSYLRGYYNMQSQLV